MSVTVLGCKHVFKKYCMSILAPFPSNIFWIQQWGQLIPFWGIKSCIKLLDEIISWLIFFTNHQVGTSWNKENSINFCVPFVPCLGFLADCKIPKVKTVSWFNCTQYLLEHDVHTQRPLVSATFHIPSMAAPQKRTAVFAQSFGRTGSSSAISRDIGSLDGTSRGNLDQDVRTQVFSSSCNILDNKSASLRP